MRKFLITLLIFSIPIIIALYPIDIFISKNLSKSNKYPGNYATWNAIYNGTINSEILIYGSSRATHHIDPDIIEDSLHLKAYNLGINGHGFWIQYLKHLEYLKYNKNPKHIILAVGWFSLEKRKDLYGYNQFLPYMLWNNNIQKYTSSYQGFSFLDYYIPSLRYYGNYTSKERVMTFTFKNSDSIKPRKNKGYIALLDEPFNSDLSKAKIKMNSGYKLKIDTATVKLLDQFINECQEKNIAVSMVYTPEYIEGQHFVNNRNDAVKIYEDLAEKYKITFLNYSNDSISLQKKYFNITMHLNKTGAELFTRKLAYDLKNNITK